MKGRGLPGLPAIEVGGYECRWPAVSAGDCASLEEAFISCRCQRDARPTMQEMHPSDARHPGTQRGRADARVAWTARAELAAACGARWSACARYRYTCGNDHCAVDICDRTLAARPWCRR